MCSYIRWGEQDDLYSVIWDYWTAFIALKLSQNMALSCSIVLKTDWYDAHARRVLCLVHSVDCMCEVCRAWIADSAVEDCRWSFRSHGWVPLGWSKWIEFVNCRDESSECQVTGKKLIPSIRGCAWDKVGMMPLLPLLRTNTQQFKKWPLTHCHCMIVLNRLCSTTQAIHCRVATFSNYTNFDRITLILATRLQQFLPGNLSSTQMSGLHFRSNATR